MIVAPIRSQMAFAEGRLDAKYHCSPGVLANERIQTLAAAGVELRPVAGDGGIGKIGATSRTRRVYAAQGEASLPYLRPYDVFDYLPQSADQLSKSGSDGLESLMPMVGTILQTCSGRNLGPLAYADEYLSRFVVSDDMLRLHIADETERFYTFAFLSSPTGQALLTRSKTGNVIDHLSSDDMAAVQVPFFEDELVEEIAEAMNRAARLREKARLTLQKLVKDFSAGLPMVPLLGRKREGWSIRAADLGTRLDVAFHDPATRLMREELLALGGLQVRDVAVASMPNRYKRYYVEAGHGRPILSGRQLLQMKPVNLKYIAARSLDFATYELGAGTLVFGARGRAEERIALPALITEDRANWLASHNVMRVHPRRGVNPGWLYLCFSTPHVQMQVKGTAFGSVVDVIDPANLNEVVLPPIDEVLGDAAHQCWKDFDEANRLETATVNRLEHEMLARA